ncbi:MBL fold metallo-hydrolase [Nocardia noduli]|uniref:MBL fold metallo-hydrolase n=1 Tax=Nocardia noduli TaxID=2815722 RepID=UPI001C211082|nr:MBL fold metallo-hydrolase [Nocardia noduli]
MTPLPSHIHRLGDDHVNFWLVTTPDGLTLIDTGLPGHWPAFTAALKSLRYSPTDITAILITHAHPDHLGLATRIHQLSGASTWIHRADTDLAAHPRALRRHARPERPLLPYLLRHPTSARTPLHLLRLGMATVPPVTATHTFHDGQHIDVPGQPIALHTPGHTPGSSSFLLPEHGIIFTGDTLVTHDAVGHHHGPTAICRAFTHDSHTATTSLQRLATIDADLVLPGHGQPWTENIATAAHQALRHGIT